MKKVYFTSFMMFFLFKISAQISMIPQKFNKNDAVLSTQQSATEDEKNNYSSSIPLLGISGLGNISSTSQIEKIDPSANIIANVSLSENRRWKLYISYNIGNSIDTVNKDSILLTNLYFPERSKNGFTGGFSIDLFRIIGEDARKTIHTLESVQHINSDDNKFYFFSCEPYFEYSYLKKIIKNPEIDIPRIETSTLILGLRLGGNLSISDNTFAITLNPYYKFVSVTDGTYATFNDVFKHTNNGFDMPQRVSFLGLNVNFQINKTILGFTYEDLKSTEITNRNVWGGVFILKATIAAEFFNFN